MVSRVVGVIVWLIFLAWSPNGFAIDHDVDGATASYGIGSCSLTSSPSTRLVRSCAEPTALSEAIHQNTPGNSEGYPEGLAWDKGFYGTSRLKPAPSGFSAVTGWGVVYPEAGTPVSPNAATCTVRIANFRTYVHLTIGTWIKVQDQAQGGINGGHYVADFSAGDTHTRWSEQTLPDGSVSVDAPLPGYNDHFWPSVRGTFTPGAVDGVYVEAQMKTNDTSANLVAQIGADWWRDSTAQYSSSVNNNPAVGGNNFIKLTTEWKTLYFTSLSPQQLQADPPPSLRSPPRPRQ
ncbi:hypothetical protein QA640_31295 [Bradyrhizobium sp. CB82]|uniref:hypothetical protein n=1 Tax=Bradyrhizobium sp. CB82 TaxID=3039159 RepID=UPI0024B09E92|nr:hypothetical protein [Bradyrhizobium sp. CB82]WFU38858.1 hypothetical protein QA640_31295 [Bradyrhizobium sp. CB82]